MTFLDFNLHPTVYNGLDAMGFEKPTPVQIQTIPLALQKKDIIACAQTGSGKTAAYLLPILHHLANKGDKQGLSALVLVPTRELAMQIDRQVEGIGYFCNASSIAVYGGNNAQLWEDQKKAILHGADILVATPGRLIAMLRMGHGDLKSIDYLILDEADRMLDMGFYNDIVEITNHLSKDRQTFMFSATMPDNIRTLARKLLREPEEISISISKPADNILQAAYMVHENQKLRLIEKLIDKDDLTSAIIFASTKIKVNEINVQLKRRKMSVDAIHSDLIQDERERIMNDFRNRKFKVLIATNIVARGIDIDNIGLIINYDVPQDPEEYVHRVGRTARADNDGIALTLITEKEQERFYRIEQLIEYEIRKIPAPPELGETPVYDPLNTKKTITKRFNRKPNFRKPRK